MKLDGQSSNRMLHSIHELNARPNPLYDIDFQQLYDLDTGRYAALPQKWRGENSQPTTLLISQSGLPKRDST